MTQTQRNILIILHGGLKEFVYATGAFAAIKNSHKTSKIILLTQKRYEELALNSGVFDEVWVDPMLDFWEWRKARAFRNKFYAKNIARVYDLQNSHRTAWYFRLLGKMKPQWSGSVSWCSHPYIPSKEQHILAHNNEQLRSAGIKRVMRPNLSFMTTDIARFGLADKDFVLIMAGSMRRNAQKRWNKDNYVEVANWLGEIGVIPVIIGTNEESRTANYIAANCTTITPVNLVGRTNLAEMADISRYAMAAVGNDTGPIYVAAYCGCPVVILYSDVGDSPMLSAPSGDMVRVLYAPEIDEIEIDDVISAIESIGYEEIEDYIEIESEIDPDAVAKSYISDK